jgi:aldo/keto reductase family protein
MRQCRLHVPQIGQAAETLGASQLADHTETVENRHLQIQEHNIGRISMDEVKGFTSVCRFDHAVPKASKSSPISSRPARLSSATRIVIAVHSGPAHFPLGAHFTAIVAFDRMATSVQSTSVQVALAWLLQRSPNILLIPGTSSTSHLREGVRRNFWKGESHPSLSILGNLPRTRSRGH